MGPETGPDLGQRCLLDIPYELTSRNLVDCAIPALWLGPVSKGDTVSREISLRLLGPRQTRVEVGSLPTEVHAHLRGSEGSDAGIHVTVSFSSEKPGLYEGAVNLLASDQDGNRQSIQLGYGAFILP